MSSLGQEDPLEKEMTTHSSIVAWKVPWTEEPGRLQSIGLQRADTTERLSLHRIHFVTKNLVKKLRKAYFQDNCIHAKIARYMLGGGGGLVAKLCLTLLQPHGL